MGDHQRHLRRGGRRRGRRRRGRQRAAPDLPARAGLIEARLPFRGVDRAGRPLEIREAVARDAPRFLDHMRALVDETTFMLQCGEDALPSLGDQRLLLEQLGRLDNCLCIVATRGEAGPGRATILGSLTLLGGQTSRTRHVCTLGMGVRRAGWGAGVGGRLLDLAVGWARRAEGIARIALQVYGSNEPARRLYDSRGFVEEGTMVAEVALPGGWEDLVGMSLDVYDHGAEIPRP